MQVFGHDDGGGVVEAVERSRRELFERMRIDDAYFESSRFADLFRLGAQDIGSKLPDRFELERLTQTEATSLLDFQGRALLIEFFAYW